MWNVPSFATGRVRAITDRPIQVLINDEHAPAKKPRQQTLHLCDFASTPCNTSRMSRKVHARPARQVSNTQCQPINTQQIAITRVLWSVMIFVVVCLCPCHGLHQRTSRAGILHGHNLGSSCNFPSVILLGDSYPSSSWFPFPCASRYI